LFVLQNYDIDEEAKELDFKQLEKTDKSTYEELSSNSGVVSSAETKGAPVETESIYKNLTSGLTSVYESTTNITKDLGKYIEDALTSDTDEHDQREKEEALIVVRSKTTPEETKSITTTQKANGCFELSENVIKELH
ncbi:18906_t:CDS:2, partial [Dentiscutata erythropus]